MSGILSMCGIAKTVEELGLTFKPGVLVCCCRPRVTISQYFANRLDAAPFIAHLGKCPDMLARLNTEQRDKLIKLRADQSSSRMEAKRRRRNPPNDGADQEQPDGGGGQQGTPDEQQQQQAMLLKERELEERKRYWAAFTSPGRDSL